MEHVDATGFCTWSSAVLFAKRILANTSLLSAFKLSTKAPSRLLELGSGTGLAGIACVLALHQAGIPASIFLTDCDARTLEILHNNCQRNMPSGSTVSWEVKKLAWEQAAASSEGPFDVIVGADIVYEPEHAQLIYEAVDALLSPNGVFHLVIPIRYTHFADVAALEQVFASTRGAAGPHIKEVTNFEQSDVGQYAHRYYLIAR